MSDYEHVSNRATERSFKVTADLATKVGCVPATTMTKSFTQDPVGWKLHLVRADPDADYDQLRYERSLCGLFPRHGWGLDMFIHEPCSKCRKIALSLQTQDQSDKGGMSCD